MDISSDLSWDMHIHRIFKKANNTLGYLRRNIKIHPKKLKSSAYKVLVCPHLEYCSTVWCPFTDSNISKREAVQCRAARLVKHDYGQTSGVTDMMQSLHWRRLDQRRIDNKLSLYIYIYKITHNLFAIPIFDFLIPLETLKTLSTISPVVLQADNCYDWLLQIFIQAKSCISLEQPLIRNCGLLHIGAVQPSSLQDWSHLTIENHHTCPYWLHPTFLCF